MSSESIKIKRILNFLLKIFVVFLIYITIFLPSYNPSKELDDKSIAFVSSQLAETGSENRQKVYEKFVSPLNITQKEIKRYQFRMDSGGMYLIPSYIMRTIYSFLGKGEFAISQAFFHGYSLPYFLVASLILFKSIFSKNQEKIFFDTYYILLLITLPFIIINFLDIFPIQYVPGASAPRGSVALLAPLVFLSFAGNRTIEFFSYSLISTLIHAGSSIFINLSFIPIVFFRILKNKKVDASSIASIPLLLINIFLILGFKTNFKQNKLIERANLDLDLDLDFISTTYPFIFLVLLSLFLILINYYFNGFNFWLKKLVIIAFSQISILLLTLTFIFSGLIRGTDVIDINQFFLRPFSLYYSYIFIVLCLIISEIMKLKKYSYIFKGIKKSFKIYLLITIYTFLLISASHLKYKKLATIYDNFDQRVINKFKTVGDGYQSRRINSNLNLKLPIGKDNLDYVFNKERVEEEEVLIIISNYLNSQK